MTRCEIRFPRIGEGVFEANISHILVKVGDTIVEDQVYMHAHTDKVDIELPSTLSGIVQAILVHDGDWVNVGDVLLVVTTQEDSSQAKRKEERGNVQTGLLYLRTKDSEYLCSRKELGRLKFDDCKGFVDEVVAIARDFQGFPLEKLDDALLDELRDTLYIVTGLVKQLVGFDPDKLGPAKAAEHKRINREIQDEQDNALQNFSDILERSRNKAGFVTESRKGWVRGYEDRAYVFISYSHADNKYADDLARRLYRAKIQYFRDTESIAPGQKIDKSVHEAISSASHMVVLISPAMAKSAWVPYEMGYAQAKGLVVVPYLLHESMDVPSFLVNYNYIKGKDDLPRLINMLTKYHRAGIPGQKFFKEWNSAFAREKLQNASKEICQQAVNIYSFTSEAQQSLSTFVQRGGRIRCILVDPYGEAIQMATRRNIGPDRSLEHVISELELTCRIFHEISQQSLDQNAVRLKVVDLIPEPVITMIDPDSPDGTMFVTLNGFEKRLGSRPSFVLNHERDEKWFNFYLESFENLWSNELCRAVNLAKTLKENR